jgi:hypothetical protein
MFPQNPYSNAPLRGELYLLQTQALSVEAAADLFTPGPKRDEAEKRKHANPGKYE